MTTAAPTLPPELADRMAQIEQQARARGCDTTPGRAPVRVAPPARATTARPAAPPQPISRWRAMLNRPLPQAWKKPSTLIRPEGLTDWEWRCRLESRRHDLVRVELRLAAKLIATALGPDWRAAQDGDSQTYWHLIHRPSGATVVMDMVWRDFERYQFDALHTYRRESLSKITVSASRSPASIAADLSRRLIDLGVVSEHERYEECEKRHRAELIQKRLSVLAVARALGVRTARSYHTEHATERWDHGYYVEHPDFGRQWDTITKVDAEILYGDRLTLTIETSDIDLAERIARLVVETYPNPQHSSNRNREED